MSNEKEIQSFFSIFLANNGLDVINLAMNYRLNSYILGRDNVIIITTKALSQAYVSLAVLICKKALQNCVGLKPLPKESHN